MSLENSTPPDQVRGTGRSPSPRWLILVAAILLLWNLNYAPFWNPDEGRYSAASLEMAGMVHGQPADWVVPHLNTIPRLNKPPLVYWLAAIFYSIFGPNEITGRLGSALANVGVLLIIWLFMRRCFDERAAIMGALVWGTAALPVSLGRTLNTDMLLTFSVALTMCSIFAAVEWHSIPSDTSRESSSTKDGPLKSCTLAGIGMGLALLAKGPVGVAMPLGIMAIYLTITKGWLRVPWSWVPVSVLLMALIGGPWYYAAESRHPGFIHQFLFEENLSRFSGDQEYHKPTSVFFYVPFVLVGMIPWSGFLFGLIPYVKDVCLSLGRCIASLGQKRLRQPDAVPDGAIAALQQRARIFVWMWALIIIGFFSFSSTKLIPYILPAFPALAMIVGMTVSRFGESSLASRILTLGLTLTINVALIAGAAVFLLNGKTIPRGDGLVFVIVLASVLAIGSGLFVWAWRDRVNPWRIALSSAGSAAVLYLCLLPLAGKIALYEESSTMLRLLSPHLQPDDKIVQYNNFSPSAIFYARRPITAVGFKNTSGLDEEVLKRSPLFLPKSTTLEQLLADRKRVFILMRRKQGLEPPAGSFSLGSTNDHRLISNRPAPEGFAYNSVARPK